MASGPMSPPVTHIKGRRAPPEVEGFCGAFVNGSNVHQGAGQPVGVAARVWLPAEVPLMEVHKRSIDWCTI